jgi:hypothetical protein
VKRIVGAVLFGLGVLVLVFGVGLAFVVAPAAAQLPYDLERSTSVAVSPDAEFLQIKAGAASINSAPLKSTVEVIPQARVTADEMTGALEGKAVVWDVYSAVRRVDNDEVVSAYSTEFATDRRTGAAVDWDGAWLEDGTDSPHNFAGQLYKFPFETEQKDYKVFDRDLRRAVTVKFDGVETLHGVETYRFKQVIPDEPLPVAETSLALLKSTFAPAAESAEVIYSNTRTFWVEPATGAYVDLSDQPRKTLVASDGSRTTLLRADFRYDEATATASAERASDNARQLALVGVWIPAIAALVGVALIVIGAVLVVAPGRRSRHRVGGEPDVGAPVPGQRRAMKEQTA